MYLLTLMVHLAVFAQALEKRDYAIITNELDMEISDCMYALLYEKVLGSEHLVSYKPHGAPLQICHNEAAKACIAGIPNRWEFIGCVQRFDAYYKDGLAPSYNMTFQHRHGTCFYEPYSDNAGGQINEITLCTCGSVKMDTPYCKW